MRRMPALCLRCHPDQVTKGGTTTGHICNRTLDVTAPRCVPATHLPARAARHCPGFRPPPRSWLP
jgi:hypothetical protein